MRDPVVVGAAASGIGAAVCDLLLESGYAVVGVDIEPTARNTERYVGVAGDGRLSSTWDLAGAAAARTFANPIFGLVPNIGGATTFANLQSLTDESWWACIDLNLMATIRAVRSILPIMLAAGRGSIVTLGSTNAFFADNGAAPAYGIAKAALVHFSRALAGEVGPRGVRVNCVCPGGVDTPGLRANLPKKGQTLADLENTARALPLGRLTRPEEVAAVVLSLLDLYRTTVNGSVVIVDGGLMNRPAGYELTSSRVETSPRSRPVG
jgi:NAD(P)-dependent dehydrogenase (short-subunit alcohol dehydrogenase family)